MRTKHRTLLGCLLILAASAALPVLAQDDEGDEEKAFSFYIEIDSWHAQPLGMEYEPATRQEPGSVVGPEILELDQDTTAEFYYRLGFELGPTAGDFMFSWYSQSQQNTLDDRLPGEFVFGEILAYPVFAGYENDGLADGFTSSANTGISDLRFDYRRLAFRSDRIIGKWFIGIRRVTHDRDLGANYLALAPNPPTVPPTSVPRPDLFALPDTARISSNFVGRGLEGGMDVQIPLGGERFKLEAGFAVAALRGRIDSSYSSTNSFYTTTDADGVTEVAPAPYNYFGNPDGQGGLIVDSVEQQLETISLSSNSRTTISPVIDLYLGFRATIWKGLELIAGFRNTYYGDVGVDLRPKVSSLTFGQNFVDVTEVDRSVEYQGLYLGVSYTF